MGDSVSTDAEATEALMDAAREVVAARFPDSDPPEVLDPSPGVEDGAGVEQEPAATTDPAAPVPDPAEPEEPAFAFAEPEPTPDTEPEPVAAEVPADDTPDYAAVIRAATGGNLLDTNTLVDVIDFATAAASLPPQQQQIINDVIKGQFDPAKYLPAQQQAPAPEQSPYGDLDLDDPYQKQIAELRAEQEALRLELARRQQEETNQRLLHEYQTGVAEFQQAYEGKIDGKDLELLQLEVNRSGILPGLVQKHRNDARAATLEAFEAVVWSNPSWRAKLLDAERAVTAEEQAREQERARRAAAVSGTGGVPSPVRVPQQSAVPKNLNEARRMAAAALSEASSFEGGNGQVA